MDAFCNQCIKIGEWLSQHRSLKEQRRMLNFTISEHGSSCSCCTFLGAKRFGNDLIIHVIGETSDCQRMFYMGNEKDPFKLRLYPLLEEDTGVPLREEYINLDLARGWLQQCEKEHTQICNVSPSLLFDGDILLVDVQDRCVVSRVANEVNYVALSYVWGKSLVTKATSANIEDLKKPQSLSEPSMFIPKAIKDAIFVTATLGVRYLWCDCLCIIQDDPNVQIYLNAMASIYAQAYLTLAITNARDADREINGLQKGETTAREMKFIVVPFPRIPMRAEYVHDLVKPESLHILDSLDLMPWSLRGWTFQEGYFSRRVLLFDHCMSWICPTCYREESGINRCPRERRYERFRPEVTKYLYQNHNLHDEHFYPSLIEEFVKRLFTFDSDIMDAFSGTLKVASMRYRHGFGNNFFHGHALESFERSLLWFSQAGTTIYQRDFSKGIGEGPHRRNIPSWSVLSWYGRLDLSFWTSPKQALPDDQPGDSVFQMARVSKQCANCDKQVAVTQSKCCVLDTAVPSVTFYPHIIVHTVQATFPVHVRLSINLIPMSIRAILDSCDGRIVGELRLHSPPNKGRLSNQSSRFDDYAFIAICSSEAYFNDTAIEMVSYWYLEQERVGRAHIGRLTGCIFALCIEWEKGEKLEHARRIGFAIIDKEAWNKNETKKTVDVMLG